jgi:hypothetical protein
MQSQIVNVGSLIHANGSVVFTSDQSLGNHKLTNVTDPASPQDAATKNYVDLAVAALASKDNVQAATTIALAAYTYNNGSAGVGATITLTVAAVLVLDGYAPVLGDRLLIKNEASGNRPYNGIYTLTTVGVLGVTQAVLTRSTDFDQPADGINGALVFVNNGAVNANTLWYCTATGSITFGTTNIGFSQFTGATYTADETTLHLSGTTFSIISTYVGQTSITTLGTIGTGTWHGTIIGTAYGGTGVDNSTGGTANTFWARPSGGAGAATYRAVTVSDLSPVYIPLIVSANFPSTSTSFAAVTGMSATLAAGGTYAFRYVVFASGGGGTKLSIATPDTLTATAIRYSTTLSDTASGTFFEAAMQTSLGATAIDNASANASHYLIDGTIVVNAGGTIQLQFAQHVASGTSNVLAGSYGTVMRIA